MRVTIVPEDRYIQVDGRGLNFDFSADANIHAIQWYGDHGTVEQKVGGSRPATIDDVQPFVDLWEAERARVDAPPPPPSEPTQAQVIASFMKAMEKHYDACAHRKNYDNRTTCALRAGYAGPFQAEGTTFAIWMDTCNVYGYQQVAAVLAGQRTMPTIEQLVSELPTAPW